MELSVLVGMGFLFLAVLQIVCARYAILRIRHDALGLQRVQVAVALNLISQTLHQDREFVSVLERFRKNPRELDAIDRVRARSWNRAATRIFELISNDRHSIAKSGWTLPPMGEQKRGPGDRMRPKTEDLIEMDPEFLALLEAIRKP